jgi:hypothetical protein
MKKANSDGTISIRSDHDLHLNETIALISVTKSSEYRQKVYDDSLAVALVRHDGAVWTGYVIGIGKRCLSIEDSRELDRDPRCSEVVNVLGGVWRIRLEFVRRTIKKELRPEVQSLAAHDASFEALCSNEDFIEMGLVDVRYQRRPAELRGRLEHKRLRLWPK